MVRGRTALLLLAAGLAASGFARSEVDVSEQVLVRRAHWPVLVEPRGRLPETAARCASLSATDVVVTLDRTPARVSALGPRPLPRLHALLIDTSNSMVPRLEEAKRAAQAYVDALPPDETVLIASFDECVELAAPATLDRATARAAIERLSTGYYTALWDALYYLVLYLETLPGEKVIVLLTDGEDSSSMKAHRFDRVLELTGSAANLTVFPIGIRLPGRISTATTSGVTTARGRLGQLATRTGGEFFEVEYVSGLDPTLRRIRRRLEERLYVSYVPPAPREAATPQRLRIRARDGVPCRVVVLGAAGRYAQRRQGRTADVERRPGTRGTSQAARCLFPDRPSSSSVELRLPSPAPSPDPGVLFAADGSHALFGRVRDIVLDSGPLFRAKPYLEQGKLRVSGPHAPVFASREIVVLTPRLATVLDRLRGPHELLQFMLELEPCASAQVSDPIVRPPLLVHGQTFLELRELLGRALFHERADYRSWAQGRARTMAQRELEVLLAGLEAQMPDDEAQRHALERAFLQRAVDPSTGRPHLPLAEWLGDIPIRTAAIELERRLIGDLLDPRLDPARTRDAADRAIGAWFKLGRWFPPAIDARVVTPLIPVYDPRRDLIGFYRFLLPRPKLLRPRPPTVPSDPLALRTFRGLVDLRGAEGFRRTQPSVVSLAYGQTLHKEVADSPCAGRRLGPKVAVELLPGSAADGPEQRVELFFDAQTGQAACFRLSPTPAGNSAVSTLGSRLESLLSRTAARIPFD